MFELLLPVALGVLGGGIGLALASKGRRNRQEILREADVLQAQGALREAVSLLEQTLAEAQPSETEFLAEVRYRLCALYPALRLWSQGEEACRALLGSTETLGLSGRHDVLRHLAHCLDAQSRFEEAAAPEQRRGEWRGAPPPRQHVHGRPGGSSGPSGPRPVKARPRAAPSRRC